MRRLLILALFALGACASGLDGPEYEACNRMPDETARQACIRTVFAADQTRQDNNGIGPPTCHPASINRDRDRPRC